MSKSNIYFPLSQGWRKNLDDLLLVPRVKYSQESKSGTVGQESSWWSESEGFTEEEEDEEEEAMVKRVGETWWRRTGNVQEKRRVEWTWSVIDTDTKTKINLNLTSVLFLLLLFWFPSLPALQPTFYLHYFYLTGSLTSDKFICFKADPYTVPHFWNVENFHCQY